MVALAFAAPRSLSRAPEGGRERVAKFNALVARVKTSADDRAGRSFDDRPVAEPVLLLMRGVVTQHRLRVPYTPQQPGPPGTLGARYGAFEVIAIVNAGADPVLSLP
jgi:hypothetical protein